MELKESIKTLFPEEKAQRLISGFMKENKSEINFYVGELEHTVQGEPSIAQLPWIPRKVKNLQKNTEKLHNLASDFQAISQIANSHATSQALGIDLLLLQQTFRKKKREIEHVAKYIETVLKDMENAVDSLSVPGATYIKSLYKIGNKGIEPILGQDDKMEYPDRMLAFTAKYMESPMIYFLFTIPQGSNMAMVSQGFRLAPLCGAGYHEIWTDLDTIPKLADKREIWRS